MGDDGRPAGGGGVQCERDQRCEEHGGDVHQGGKLHVPGHDPGRRESDDDQQRERDGRQTPTGIGVAPATVSVATNATQPFTATVTDQFGAAMSPQPAVTWSVAGGGTISVSGLFTAGGVAGGPFTVTAAIGALTGIANVTVTPVNAPPSVVTAASAAPSPVTGTTTVLSVLGDDDGGEASLTYTWSTTGIPPAGVTFSANGSNAAKNTVATFTKAGTYAFQVTIRDAGSLTTTSGVSVTVTQTLTVIGVAPLSASVVISATQPFTATASDQFGTAMSPPPAIAWSVSGGGAISTSGLFTAGSLGGGPFVVTAASGAVSGTASVTVTAAATVPTYVQGVTATNNGNATTLAAALTSAATAGDLIVAAVSWGGNASLTCSDSQGNTYVVASTQYDSANNQSLGICYAANVKVGTTTVTATFSASMPYRRLLIHQYRGVALINPVDVVAKNVANGTTAADAITSTAAVTLSSGDLIFGAVMDDAGVTSVTAGTGFTQRLSVNSKDLVSEDRVQAAAGSVAATERFSAAHRYLAQMVAFKHR